METVDDGIYILRLTDALKPSLEGWKRRVKQNRLAVIKPLKPSLEGWKPERYTIDRYLALPP